MIECGIDDRGPAPRGRHRRPGRDRHALRHRWSRWPTSVLMYKYIVRNVARQHGKTATFMPKPLFGDNGSGMHIHQSPVEGRRAPLFAGSGYAGCQRHWRCTSIGGLLKHAPALLRLRQPDDQQLQAPGARLRGPGEPRLLAPQPLGRRPHPDVHRQPQGQAHRVPLPRPDLQPLPGLLRRC